MQATKSQVAGAADRFEALLQAQRDDHRREKALYHLGRLRKAVEASHQEAVRFAAFTVNKTVHDAAADWGTETVDAMAALRAALADAGHEF